MANESRTPGKLGALAPRRPYGLSTLSVYANGKLPTPPTSVAVPNVPDWGMMLNDTYGDCTVAGVGHAIITWNAEVTESDHVPTDPEIQTTYFDLTGGADSGCVEADVLQTWHTNGLFGQHIAGYVPVDPHNLTEVHQAIAFYGGAYIGVALPASAQQQFANNETWTVVPGSQIEGGHCVWICGYDQDAVDIVTWGTTARVSYPWLHRFTTEVWAILPNQFIEAGRGPSLDLTTLQADLRTI